MLAGAEGVDDGGRGSGGEGAVRGRAEGGNGLGDGRVDDLGRVVPQALGAHAGAGLDVGGGEVGDVGEGDELLDARVAAAGAGDGQVDAQVRAGEDVEADHADAESGLVRVDGLPLGGRDGGTPAVGVLVRNLADDDDAAVVALLRAGRQGGQRDAGLGHEHDLIGDAIALQALGSGCARVGVAGEDEDGVGERLGGQCEGEVQGHQEAAQSCAPREGEHCDLEMFARAMQTNGSHKLCVGVQASYSMP